MARFLHGLNREIEDIKELHHYDFLEDLGHIASQCPNKRTMVLREKRDIESEISQEESTYSSEVEFSSNHSHYESDIFMFFSIIIDGGSNVNVASSRLVGKLGVTTLPHPKPCKLQ
ncbi:hypothetical protein CR513_46624, partial [Mucuna pruriens]